LKRIKEESDSTRRELRKRRDLQLIEPKEREKSRRSMRKRLNQSSHSTFLQSSLFLLVSDLKLAKETKIEKILAEVSPDTISSTNHQI
jgi:hypothetical protein